MTLVQVVTYHSVVMQLVEELRAGERALLAIAYDQVAI